MWVDLVRVPPFGTWERRRAESLRARRGMDWRGSRDVRGRCPRSSGPLLSHGFRSGLRERDRQLLRDERRGRSRCRRTCRLATFSGCRRHGAARPRRAAVARRRRRAAGAVPRDVGGDSARPHPASARDSRGGPLANLARGSRSHCRRSLSMDRWPARGSTSTGASRSTPGMSLVPPDGARSMPRPRRLPTSTADRSRAASRRPTGAVTFGAYDDAVVKATGAGDARPSARSADHCAVRQVGVGHRAARFRTAARRGPRDPVSEPHLLSRLGIPDALGAAQHQLRRQGRVHDVLEDEVPVSDPRDDPDRSFRRLESRPRPRGSCGRTAPR